MKRIFLLLLSASVASVSCSGGGTSSVGKPGTKGELIPREKTKSFVAERPYGMVAIPAGSFVAGLTDEDLQTVLKKLRQKQLLFLLSSWMKQKLPMLSIEYLSIM
jgi:hypothetical protein